jgi:hypothetical protein
MTQVRPMIDFPAKRPAAHPAPQLFLSWRDALESVRSRGQSRSIRIRHQGDLHAARAETLGQYFTPRQVARFMWSLVEPAIDRAFERTGARCPVIDTSCGSGRLLAFAKADRCLIDGADVDGRLIGRLSDAAKQWGVGSVFENACMSELSFSGYSVALINPPFSVQLSSPVMDPLPCTSHGKYGPATSAVSHEFSLDQALAGAEIVCALLPSSQAHNLPGHALERLVARFDLPTDTFREENARVATSVCLFADRARGIDAEVRTLSAVPAQGPDLGLNCRVGREVGFKRLTAKGVDFSAPSITLPVTGESSVRVFRSGRKIRLGFDCGLMQARVMNALLRCEIPHDSDIRRPGGWCYLGDGLFDLHVHLAQRDPLASFRDLVAQIHSAGGCPEVDQSLERWIEKKTAYKRRVMVPPERWVMTGDSPDAAIKAVAREAFMVDPDDWSSPSVMMGEVIELVPVSGECFEATICGQTCRMPRHEVERRFDLPRQERQWRQIHKGRAGAYPAAAAAIRLRMDEEGITEWLTWPHQISSVIENKMVGRGLLAWRMSLGKARGAIALCLLGGRHNLIVVEPYLVDEMKAELNGLGLDCWREIHRVSDLDQLARINLVTYNRLRARNCAIARRLRRRCHTVVLDEADILSNPSSQRSRATKRLCGRETYLLSGTPAANYPRDTLPLVAHAWGDATAWQPYGIHGPYLDPGLRQTAHQVARGLDVFREDFCTLVWSTNEFAEDNRSGAKREIPVIANPPRFRAWLSPLMSRWTGFEPPLEGHLSIPVPRVKKHVVAWDDGHLAHYLKVADEFRAWYERARLDGRANNLVSVLARIGAVEVAANSPAQGKMESYTPATSKQRAVVARAAELARAGKKTIVVARYPAMLDRMAGLLESEHAVESIRVHGGRSIAKRNRDLQELFRNGSVNVAFVSFGCGERGLNLPEASHLIFASRCWKSTTENQVIARLCRAQQQNQVWVERFELEGSIDHYQDQMCAFKSEAELVGVDFGESSMEAEEFAHIDTILGRFVEEVAALRGCQNGRELREVLAA